MVRCLMRFVIGMWIVIKSVFWFSRFMGVGKSDRCW